MTAPDASGPLAGLRVVELGGIGPVPFAGMVLADAGAAVTAIGRPRGRFDAVDPLTAATGGVLGRGRQEITLDLKDPDDRAAALALVAAADAVLEGFRPGALERLGLGPDVLLAANPTLVLGRMTGWGQDGPLAHAPGHDINYLALSGVLAHLGEPDRGPRAPLNLLADFGGGAMLAFGVVAAVLGARQSGRGRVVDAAMLDAAALLSTMAFELWNRGDWDARRGHNVNDGAAPFYCTYATSDQRYVAVGAMEPAFWSSLLERLGLDPAALPAQYDRAGWPQLQRALAAAFATRTRDEWAAELADVCVSPVLNFAEAPQHPHNLARGLFVAGEHGPMPAPAPRFPS